MMCLDVNTALKFHADSTAYVFASDVTMCHVTVLHGPDAVGVVMYDVDGTVNVDTSTFYNNTCSEQSSPRGGGVVMESLSCVHGDRECVDQMFHNANARYTFNHTTFKSNSANTKTQVICTMAGDLTVFFRCNATGNCFKIVSCELVGNKDASGGGLLEMETVLISVRTIGGTQLVTITTTLVKCVN